MGARLVSVNVGMPKDVSWRGKTVHTGIWKSPVAGPVMVRRLNIDGDGHSSEDKISRFEPFMPAGTRPARLHGIRLSVDPFAAG